MFLPKRNLDKTLISHYSHTYILTNCVHVDIHYSEFPFFRNLNNISLQFHYHRKSLKILFPILQNCEQDNFQHFQFLYNHSFDKNAFVLQIIDMLQPLMFPILQNHVLQTSQLAYNHVYYKLNIFFLVQQMAMMLYCSVIFVLKIQIFYIL